MCYTCSCTFWRCGQSFHAAIRWDIVYPQIFHGNFHNWNAVVPEPGHSQSQSFSSTHHNPICWRCYEPSHTPRSIKKTDSRVTRGCPKAQSPWRFRGIQRRVSQFGKAAPNFFNCTISELDAKESGRVGLRECKCPAAGTRERTSSKYLE